MTGTRVFPQVTPPPVQRYGVSRPARPTCARTTACVFTPGHGGTCLTGPQRPQVSR